MTIRRLPFWGAFYGAAWLMSAPAQAAAAPADCVPVGAWAVPADGRRLAALELTTRAARESVVLLGETHDNAEHHRWQLQAIAALHLLRPDMVLAFEMFPRRVQPALDRWVAGELGEQEFLAAAEWRTVWTFDPQLYLPLFHFARMNRVPMVALNVERELIRQVGEKGFAAVPPEKREGVTRPAPPSAAYLDYLLPVYSEHLHGRIDVKADRNSADFQRFVQSQQVWDRAMAQRIGAALRKPSEPLVVGIMGTGHIAYGYGVPHQLKDLGITRVASLLPWDRGGDCGKLSGFADAVFGVAAAAAQAAPRPRLGIWLEPDADGVRVRAVDKDSIAEVAGMRAGDVVTEAAGLPVRQFSDIAAAVQRQAPGTWLPLAIKRQGETIALVAKFPPQSQ